MDKETRGLIEKTLDYSVETLDINDITGWILEEYPAGSIPDLALGYVLGSLARYAHRAVMSEKWTKKFQKKREKELGKEFVKEMEEKSEKTTKNVKAIRVHLTKKDTAEIRDILRRRILDIMDRINRELNR